MRATFRPIVDGAPAWQKQLRDQVAEPAPPVDLALKDAVVRPVSRAAAERVILRYEWLGTLPSTRRHYGIFFGPYLAGVTAVAVGNGAGGAYGAMQFGIERLELATLQRGACVSWAPPGTNSKLVSWTVRLLARDEPAVKLMIAFADSEAGEVGTIYQAAGWTYLGPGARVTEWVAPNGGIRNNATVLKKDRRGRRSTVWMAERLRAAGWKAQQSNPKGRYAVVVDRRDEKLVDRVAAMALPYPKRPVGSPAETARPPSRGEGEADDAPAYQVGEGASRRPRRSIAPRRTGGGTR